MKRVFFIVGDEGDGGVAPSLFFNNEFAGAAAIWPMHDAISQQTNELPSQETKAVAVAHQIAEIFLVEDQIRPQGLNEVERLALRRQKVTRPKASDYSRFCHSRTFPK